MRGTGGCSFARAASARSSGSSDPSSFASHARAMPLRPDRVRSQAPSKDARDTKFCVTATVS